MAKKAIFLDRDNTLIEDPGYINNPDQVKLLPGVSKALIELKNMGYLLLIVTNQSAVARGIVSEKGLEKIHHQLTSLLAHEGAYIDKIYHCPYHPDGVIPKYRKESNLRKPQPGMILAASDELDIDLENSWMVGNSYRDIAAGLNAGCKTILIDSSVKPTVKKPNDPTPNEKAVNIKEAVNIIKMHQRQQTQPKSPELPLQTSEPPPLQEQQETQESEEIPQPSQIQPQPPELPTKQEEAKQNDLPEVEETYEPHEQERKPAVQTENLEDNKSEQMINDKEKQSDKAQQLLEEILRLLKAMQRESMFSEFSVTRLLAGAFQAIVFFCLLISIWFWMDPTKTPASVHTVIGYAIVFQLMVIAFYMMRGR
jgi:D-glycero-D-manno-heptose 1,7-bisphosphate phosphatase